MDAYSTVYKSRRGLSLTHGLRILLVCVLTLTFLAGPVSHDKSHYILHAAPNTSCQLTWEPNPDPHAVGASAIAPISDTDVWAASDSILHWDGINWNSVHELPNRAIVKFAVVSPTDIWGVGWQLENSYPHSIVMHWDGASWNDVSVPDVGILSGIVALSPKSVWVIGNPNHVPTAMHWNGMAWESLPLGYSDWRVRTATVSSISAITENDIWAVGGFDGVTSSVSDVMVWHWDGIQWNYMPTQMGMYSYFGAVYAVGQDDVWAVGQTDRSQALVAHWTGTAWNPDSNHKGALYDVSGSSTEDIWAVGRYETVDSSQFLLEHWDGTQWQIVNFPKREGYQNNLSHLGVLSQTNVWAVGSEILHGGLPCVSTKPAKPELLSPPNQVDVASTSVKLRWKRAAGTAWYQVTVKKGDTIADQQFNLTAPRYVTKALKKNHTYTWRAKACNSMGCRSSPWWEFVVPK